jgi:hypothetical protein
LDFSAEVTEICGRRFGTRVFEAPATVVYSHAHLGMGWMFGEVLGNSQNVLQNWLPVAS